MRFIFTIHVKRLNILLFGIFYFRFLFEYFFFFQIKLFQNIIHHFYLMKKNRLANKDEQKENLFF